MRRLKEVRWLKRVLGAFLLFVLFAGAFETSVTLSMSVVPRYFRASAGLHTEGNTIYFTPRHTFNGIQEWAPRSKKDGELAEWGIRVRPETPAEMEATWRDRNDDDETFGSMEVSVNLGGNLRARVKLDPSDVFSPVDVTCSSGDKIWEHRDVDGDGIFDMLFERVMENGVERLVKASVQYRAGYHDILLEKPFDDKECTIMLPNNEVKKLVYEKGVWVPRVESSESGV